MTASAQTRALPPAGADGEIFQGPVVYFGNDWSGENRTSSHHIALRLGRRFPLLYVDAPTRAPKATGRDLRKIGRVFRRMWERPRPIGTGMWQTTVPQLPFRRLPLVKALNDLVGALLVKRAMSALGFRNPVLWFATPVLAHLAGRLGARLSVYYCIDDYAALPDTDVKEVAKLDERLTRRAEQVFVSSVPLLDRKLPLNATTVYSPHGVDADHFRRAADADLPIPEAAKNLRHPVIGFYGSVSGWIDIDLLEFLGKAHPEWTYLMIGLVTVDVSALRRLPNFVFIDAQPYESLPGWLKAFDVGLQPYLLNSQTLHCNPLKLREYLAAGKPVVSLSVPEVERFKDVVGTAHSHGEFLVRIEEALAQDSPELRAKRQQLVASATWEARVEEAWAIVERQLRHPGSGNRTTKKHVA